VGALSAGEDPLTGPPSAVDYYGWDELEGLARAFLPRVGVDCPMPVKYGEPVEVPGVLF
jgi:hypothetical protein